MRRSTSILLLTTAALAATSTWLWRALDGERTRANSLQALMEQTESLAAAAIPESTASDDSALDDTGVVEEKVGAQQPPEKKDFNAWERRMLQNESYREARRRYRQLELGRGHMDLAGSMGISQETADRLIALLVEGELRYLGGANRNPRNEKEMRIRQMENLQAQHEQDAELDALRARAKQGVP